MDADLVAELDDENAERGPAGPAAPRPMQPRAEVDGFALGVGGRLVFVRRGDVLPTDSAAVLGAAFSETDGCWYLAESADDE